MKMRQFIGSSARLGVALTLATVAAGLGLYTASLQAAPTPSLVPIAWELKIKYHLPERVEVTLPGETTPKTFWYIRYTVTNDTGREILFVPEFQMITDTGQILEGNRKIAPEVFTKIKSIYKDPLMESPEAVLGKLLRGEDNARDSVAIFSDVDTNVRDMRFVIAGFSGETAEVINPVTNEKVLLKKSLVLDFELAGQALGVAPEPKFKSAKWVMK